MEPRTTRHVIAAILCLFTLYVIGPVNGYSYHFGKFTDYWSAIQNLDPAIKLFGVQLTVLATLMFGFPVHFSAFTTEHGYNPVVALEVEAAVKKSLERREILSESLRDGYCKTPSSKAA